jgi:hypothetical protein
MRDHATMERSLPPNLCGNPNVAPLPELMLRHQIGVRVERKVEVLDVDQNYFSDKE